jgi:RecJ-like exonuclease
MKRCDICDEYFNPHEETTCKECRKQSQAISFERYLESRGLIKEFELLMQDFVDKYDPLSKYFTGRGREKLESVLGKLNNDFKELLSKIEIY